MKKIFLLLIPGLLLMNNLQAQNGLPYTGLRDNPPGIYVLKNATIVPEPGKEIKNAGLVVRDGRISEIGESVNIPKDALVLDMKGTRIYPALMDVWSDYGLPKPEGDKRPGPRAPQYETARKGPWNWNQAIRGDYEAQRDLTLDGGRMEKLRANGFALLNVVPQDGIMRGYSATIALDVNAVESQVIRGKSGFFFSFDKGISTQAYPSSQMGGIALIRQTLMDGDWYPNARTAWLSGKSKIEVPEDLALEAWIEAKATKLPLFFEVKDHLELQRADLIAKAYGLKFIYRTSGDEYQRPDVMKALNPSLIIPLNFPKAMQVQSPEDARTISLGSLREWLQAPGNAAFLEKNGNAFSFTTAGLEKPEDMFAAVRTAMAYGLSEQAALSAFTTSPATLLGLSDQTGTLAPGKLANFIVCTDSLFKNGNEILETWVRGKRFIQKTLPDTELRGKWKSDVAGYAFELNLKGKRTNPEGEIRMKPDTTSLKITIQNLPQGILLTWKRKENEAAKTWRYSGQASGDRINGFIETPDGNRVQVEWKRTETFTSPPDTNAKSLKPAWVPPVTFPNKSYGWSEMPQQEQVLIRDVTVWTNTAAGKMEHADVLISNGKIQQVGKGLKAPSGATVIEGNGRHLTPGIIDEHSHIAISKGVNEGSHSVTAEVRIGDVIDPEDINIYRQLAGGVTTSHLLHGSANSIGGQTALIKLRWGMNAEEMKFEGADGFIKFALGENVKQSNWGDMNNIRYPQTRMGVEQVMRDAFQAAIEYRNRKRNGELVKPDLRLETLIEILEKRRFITCHSYVQSEITMLMRLAESFGFRVNTFTHVLEGYKIADKIKAHGAYASTFSDWWAYKYEVIDAIPHNASLMTENGVTVCINSDDAEMGRRLNQEAAKGMKYGGMKEEDALKMVTLNPAKALHIDNRVGSIAEGKDADVVLWSAHPLSVYSHSDITWVDGRRMYELEKQKELQENIRAEKAKIIQLMLDSPDPVKAPPTAKENKLYHCETLESDYNE